MEDIVSLEAKLAQTKEREKELESRVEELNDFIENASIPLHWVNGSGVIIWANKAELDLLGYSKEEYIGKHISTFHANKKVIEDILVRLTNKETLKNCPAVLKSKSGALISVLINSNVRWVGDKFVHTRCFTRDISDLKKVEEENLELLNDLHEKNKALRLENESLKKTLNSLNKSV